jgi:hypothetical protein
MTRYEAAQALKAGKKLTQTYFSPDEWVMGLGDGNYLLEDGCKCTAAEFWKWRQQEFFNDGWKLFEEMTPTSQPASSIRGSFNLDGTHI